VYEMEEREEAVLFPAQGYIGPGIADTYRKSQLGSFRDSEN